jgi:hypothetical protein
MLEVEAVPRYNFVDLLSKYEFLKNNKASWDRPILTPMPYITLRTPTF